MLDRLKPSRYKHSLGVEKMASKLAECYGADIEKASFAGRYHDIAKCLDDETANRLIREYGLPESLLYNNPLAHSKIASKILSREFGVEDEDVLNAVAYHTTGRYGMSLLEEIVYVSDAIEENRSYPELPRLQEQATTDLDGACLFIMDYTIDQIKLKNKPIDSDTIEARDFIADRINNETKLSLWE